MGRLQPGINDLYTWCIENGDFGQRLLSEWVGKDENDNDIDIHKISRGNHTNVKWKCNNNHYWLTQINRRTSCKSNCPYCSGKKASEENSLYTWCQKNGSLGNDILSEWTGETTDGDYIDIKNITYGSGIDVKWNCKYGHEYYSKIYVRTNGHGCPYCCGKGTSYPEQFIYWALKQIYPQTISRGKYKGIEYDITVPEERLCIEYSPTRWHSDKKERDQLKADICKEHNMRFIYIKEDTFDEYEETWEDDYICFRMKISEQDNLCIKIVNHIISSLNHNMSDIDIDLVKKNAYEYSHGAIDYEKSIKYLYPELAKEWNENLNSIDIDNITKGSRFNANWKCSKCGYEWKCTVTSRINQKQGCPLCGYNWHDGKTHNKAGNKLLITGKNDLSTLYPELAKEWDYELNNFEPNNIKPNSNSRVHWICRKCGYKWQSTPNARVHHKSGCNNCGFNCFTGEQTMSLRYICDINNVDYRQFIRYKYRHKEMTNEEVLQHCIELSKK